MSFSPKNGGQSLDVVGLIYPVSSAVADETVGIPAPDSWDRRAGHKSVVELQTHLQLPVRWQSILTRSLI